jgi:hypothetical protein
MQNVLKFLNNKPIKNIFLISAVMISTLLFYTIVFAEKLPDIRFEENFIVFKLDVTANDLDGIVSEQSEEIPGAYIHYNLNDDNLNNKHDYMDITVSGENDLKKASLEFVPLPDKGKVTLSCTNNSLSIWEEANKTKPILVNSTQKTWDLSLAKERDEFTRIKDKLWIEGTANQTAVLTVEYKDKNGISAGSDKIKYTPIAAVCGRQPTVEERTKINGWFPNIINCEWSITGEETPVYNCIAWSVGETTTWYVDIEENKIHSTDIAIDNIYGIGNGDGLMTNAELDAFYQSKGYEVISNIDSADVLYYSNFHGAKKKDCSCGAGKWIMFESKCGEAEKIEHVRHQLNGSTYGMPIRYYKRK